MQINVTFKPPLKTLAKKFGNIEATRFLSDKITKLAFLIEREAKQVTPVDTGRLRASVRVEPMIRPLERVIAPHTEYATYVHQGTRYIRARPFMLWGARTATSGFETNLVRGLEAHIQSKIR